MADQPAPPLALDEPEAARQLRDAFVRAGYEEARILGFVGAPNVQAIRLKESRRPALLRKTAGGGPLATLVRLFLLDLPAGADAVRRALHPLTPEDLTRIGVLRPDPDRGGDTLRATAAIMPFQGLLVAHDAAWRAGGMAADYVLGLSHSTVALSLWTARSPARTTLDLGCGGGFQAFLAAAHSDRVIGTDVNPRALNLARFNAQLNALDDRVEFRQGDLFEPVAHAGPFDLIVSNPPFVISPGTGHVFRDSGLRGDAICRAIIRDAPRHLVDGGLLQMLCNWEIGPDGSWRDRLASWFDDLGCDAWVLHSDTIAVEEYATDWMPVEMPFDPDVHARRFDAWMDDYAAQGIAAVGAGVITLRRRDRAPGGHWVRIDPCPPQVGPCGDSILRGLRLHDLVLSLPDDAPLSRRFRRNPDMVVEQHLQPTETSWTVAAGLCRLTRGMAYVGELDIAGFHLLSLCLGDRTLSAILPELAARIGEPVEAVTPGALAVVRAMLDQGFLLPVDAD